MSEVRGKVIGFRGWSISRNDHGLILCGTGVGGEWEPGINEAKCTADHSDPTLLWSPSGHERDPWYKRFHEAPAPNCQCGFYALHDIAGVGEWSGVDAVHGVIAAWGRMEVHATGFRAQYAQPVLLALPEKVASEYPYAAELLRECAARYGAQVVRPEELTKAAMEFGEPVPKKLRPKPKPAEPSDDYMQALRYYNQQSQRYAMRSWHYPSGTGTVVAGSSAPIRRKKSLFTCWLDWTTDIDPEWLGFLTFIGGIVGACAVAATLIALLIGAVA